MFINFKQIFSVFTSSPLLWQNLSFLERGEKSDVEELCIITFKYHVSLKKEKKTFTDNENHLTQRWKTE